MKLLSSLACGNVIDVIIKQFSLSNSTPSRASLGQRDLIPILMDFNSENGDYELDNDHDFDELDSESGSLDEA